MRVLILALRVGASAAAAGAAAGVVCALYLIIMRPVSVARAIAERDAVIVANELTAAIASLWRLLLQP